MTSYECTIGRHRLLACRQLCWLALCWLLTLLVLESEYSELTRSITSLLMVWLASPGGHYRDINMSVMASQITSVSNVCSAHCPGADQRKHQGSASLAFVSGIHRWPVDSPHKGPVTRKMLAFDDVFMNYVGYVVLCILQWRISATCTMALLGKCRYLCVSSNKFDTTRLTPGPLGGVAVILKIKFSNSCRIVAWATMLLSDECHRTSLMRIQHWIR